MIFVDRLALVWGGFLIIIMAMVWRGDGFLLDDPGIWRVLGLVVGIPWLALRALDIVFTGRIRLGAMGKAIGRARRPHPYIDVIPPSRGHQWEPPGSGSRLRER